MAAECKLPVTSVNETEIAGVPPRTPGEAGDSVEVCANGEGDALVACPADFEQAARHGTIKARVPQAIR